jgi:peptidoglycan/LPS O-acetylase OafA/YrhL
MGVSLFFILSGFIMYYNYARKADNLSKRSYWVVRFARIYPIYAIAMLISMPGFAKEVVGSVAKIASPEFLPHFLTRFLVIHSWFPQYSERWNTPSWSLACEAFFYLLFPFIIPLAVRWSRTQTLAIFGAACLLALSSPLIAEAGQLDHAALLFKFLYYSPIMHLPQFVAGIALARMYVEKYINLERNALAWFVGALCLIFALATVFKDHTIFTQCGIMIIPFSIVIVSLASGENVLSRILASKTMQLLGDASYSLYILHSPIHGFMQKVMPSLDPKEGSLTAALFVYLPTITLISIAAFLLIEKPARTAIRTWAKA